MSDLNMESGSRKTIQLGIVSPSALLYESDVSYVQIPLHDGLIGVLPGHAPYVSILGFGVLTLNDEIGVSRFVIDGGFVEITPERITVLANHGENLEKVDFEAAQRDYDEVLQMSATGEVEMQRLQDRLQAARTRLAWKGR
ncbi:MAG: ATP synthase F1 subunit epsilon [Spirochaetales bacterium]|nr:ATP synthase F1 subunit epsilon [Spirochaetales bacterium]